MKMTCQTARQRLPVYVREVLPAAESALLRGHLLACGDCHAEYEYLARLHSPLRELQPVDPPEELAALTRLRALSERSRRPTLWQRWEVRLSNLMGPVALPAAAGLLSALILFAALMPAVRVIRADTAIRDIPTVLSTEPRFRQASVLPLNEDLLVEAWISEEGKVTSFQVLNPGVSGADLGEELRHQVTNVLLTTLFQPATLFGQPTAGKIILSLHRINVHG